MLCHRYYIALSWSRSDQMNLWWSLTWCLSSCDQLASDLNFPQHHCRILDIACDWLLCVSTSNICFLVQNYTKINYSTQSCCFGREFLSSLTSGLPSRVNFGTEQDCIFMDCVFVHVLVVLYYRMPLALKYVVSSLITSYCLSSVL